MKKTAIEIYALLICFSAMVCLSINAGLVIYNIVSLANPELTLSDYQYQDHQTNDSYWRYRSGRSGVMQINDWTPHPKETNNPAKQRPTEDKLTQQRLASYQNALDAEARSATSKLIFEFIVIFISSILFFIHWRFVLHKNQGVV